MTAHRFHERRLGRGLKKWLLLVLIAVALVSPRPLAHAGTALVVTREVVSPQAIVMLASHEWERLPAAAALARQYPEAVVLLTVPRVVTRYNCHLCGARTAWLEVEGVDRSRVRELPQKAVNTYEEALAVRAYTASARITRVLVVTSPYHTRRALATFDKVFAATPVQVGVVPADPAQARPESWWTTPYDRHYVLYEWAAAVKYRLWYDVHF